jgi:hypothetical protein
LQKIQRGPLCTQQCPPETDDTQDRLTDRAIVAILTLALNLNTRVQLYEDLDGDLETSQDT